MEMWLFQFLIRLDFILHEGIIQGRIRFEEVPNSILTYAELNNLALTGF